MRPAIFLVLFGAVCALPRQQNNVYPRGLISDLASAFGFDDGDPTSTAPASTRLIGEPLQTSDSNPAKSKTLVPPATAASSTIAVTKSAHPPPPGPSSTDSSSTDSNTDSSTVTSVSSSASNTQTSTSSASSPPASSSTSTPAAPTGIPTDQSSSQQTSSNNNSNSGNGGVSGGGIAVAVIMTLAVLAIIAWLVFRHHPKVRAWWLAREENRMRERSYRDAIDGPFARGSGTGARNEALGHSRRSVLASFFAPRTVRLGDGKEIRRKPVNWGASSPRGGVEQTGAGMEKVALTNMAAPMARTESTKSTVSNTSSLASALTVKSTGDKALPPMPPLPPVPPEPQRPRDVHKILSRKSIFELA